MYQLFTYICINSHQFITKYAEIIIKQHTSKTPTTKFACTKTLTHYLQNHTLSNQTQNSTKYEIAHKQMLYTSLKTSGDAIQPKHQPLTPTTIEIMPTFTHTYLFTPHTHTPTHLNQ